MTKARDYKIRADGKKDTGRPTVMTPEIINKLEQAFSMGCGDLEACLYADLTPSVLYRYQESHPEFKERKAMLKEKLILKARTVIANSLNEKDKDVAKWYLERKRKDEFSAKIENNTNLTLKTALVEFIDGTNESEDSEDIPTPIN